MGDVNGGKGSYTEGWTRETSQDKESAMRPLEGQIAVVTGASRGVGKGIALGLGEAGATVYVTGRSTHKGAGRLVGDESDRNCLIRELALPTKAGRVPTFEVVWHPTGLF